MKADGVQFSLGFMKSTPVWSFGGPRSFGSPGAGGSLGFADPEHNFSFGLTKNLMKAAPDAALSTSFRVAELIRQQIL